MVIIIPVAVILFALLLLSRLKIVFIYTQKDKDGRISTRLAFLGGMFALKFDISTADVIQRGVRKILAGEGQEKPGEEVGAKGLFGIKGLYDLLKGIMGIAEEFSETTDTIRSYFLSEGRILFEKISLEVTVGLKDASATGIVCGMVQALLGILDSFILNNFKVLDRSYFVRSDYAGEVRRIEINLLCIISTRIVHIIMVGFILAVTGIKREILDRRWFKWISIQ